MKQVLAFDDVLIEPGYSEILTRKDVSLATTLGTLSLELPVISAPMDTVTIARMANELYKHGAIGALHRFYPNFNQMVNEYLASPMTTIVSIGLNDWERVNALWEVGARFFLLDVAHGAQKSVVNFTKVLKNKYPDMWLMVGNFATGLQLDSFEAEGGLADCYRIGIGGGSVCETRIKTGCGLPTLASLLDIDSHKNYYAELKDIPLVADGGFRTPGDIAKALAAGASAVMLGGMLAGTDETGTHLYRGSACAESYQVQGKTQDYITAEGVSITVGVKGPVEKVLNDIKGGLRSAFTYVGVDNIKDFQHNAQLVQITSAGMTESKSHGRFK